MTSVFNISIVEVRFRQHCEIMNTHYGQLTEFLHERYHHTPSSSSPFIRQGFGRISTTSGKFNPVKGLTHFTDNNTMQNDEGHYIAGDMEGNRTFSYISHQSTKETKNDYKICKTIGNGHIEVSEEKIYSEDIPTTRRSKVIIR